MSYFVWNKIDHAVVREDDGDIIYRRFSREAPSFLEG
uniref:Uncharacterized protein n=1 Tax=Shewanella putrefaciens (strain 200) TaxID=399804 RepID=E6XG16_SHEP2